MKWNTYSNAVSQRETRRTIFSSELINEAFSNIVLDIGCGSGAVLSRANRNTQKVGLEENIVQAKIARDNVNCPIVVANATMLPFITNTVGVIALFEVLEHIPSSDHETLSKEIHRVLSAQGRIVMSVPYNNLLSKLFDPAWYFGHKHFSRSQIAQWLIGGSLYPTRIFTRAGKWEILSMINLYVCKHIFGKDMLFRQFFEGKRGHEFDTVQNGYMNLFAVGIKH